MSFLEQQLAAMGVDASGTAKVKAVPEELLDEWIDNDGAVPLLEEVLREGDEEQVSEANELIGNIR